MIQADLGRLVRQQHKSGPSAAWSVGISTYGGSVDVYNQIADDLGFECSIERHSGFPLVFLVAKEARQIDIFPSVAHTWRS